MAILSKEDLMQKVTEKITDEDLSLELIEDISDSFDECSKVDTSELDSLKTEHEQLQSKYDELKSKYVDRFMSGSNSNEPKKIEEPTQKKIIDIREI